MNRDAKILKYFQTKFRTHHKDNLDHVGPILEIRNKSIAVLYTSNKQAKKKH